MTETMLNARDTYIDLIKKELLGPGSEISIPDAEHELISISPHTRYSIGILFPRNNKLNADNNESVRNEEMPEADSEAPDSGTSTQEESAPSGKP